MKFETPSLSELQREVPTAMKGELELYREILDDVMNNDKYTPAEYIDKSVKQVAAKLVEEGMTTQTFVMNKAMDLTRNVAAPMYVKLIIEHRTSDVLEWMRIFQIQRTAKKFGL